LTSNKEALFVAWDNPTDDNKYLWLWYCDFIYYNSPEANNLCSFDIENIALTSPPHSSNLALPVTFQWQKRWLSTDSYELDILDSDDNVPWWWSPLLSYVGTYQLNSLPNGFYFGPIYAWDVWVYGPRGYGYSYYYREIAFNSGSSPSPGFEDSPGLLRPDHARDARPLIIR
jgi:hypothetical protein